MASRHVFRIGVALFLFLPVVLVLDSLWLVLPPLRGLDSLSFSSILLSSIIQMLHGVWLWRLAVYAFSVGLILLVAHHSVSSGTGEKAYRLLDRSLAVLLLVLLVFFLVLRFYPWQPDFPSPYVGLLRWLVVGIPVFSAAVWLIWAYSLWTARQRMALLFSVCAVAMSFRSYIPANNADYDTQIEAFYGQQGQSDVNAESSSLLSTDAEASSLDTDNMQTVSSVTITQTGIPDYFFVMLLIYTWLRRTELTDQKEHGLCCADDCPQGGD